MERNEEARITRQDPGAEPCPDYLALVIEWDDEPLGGEPEDITLTRPQLPTHGSRALRGLAIGLGALGALAAAGWGIHKLREA